MRGHVEGDPTLPVPDSESFSFRLQKIFNFTYTQHVVGAPVLRLNFVP